MINIRVGTTQHRNNLRDTKSKGYGTSSNDNIEIWRGSSQHNITTTNQDAISEKASDIADEFEYIYDPHLYHSARG